MEKSGRPQVVTVGNLKGGCGKTTTCVTLAQAARSKGKKALLIDFDPQGNAGFFLGADLTRPGTFELMEGEPVRELIQQTEQGIDVIPASLNLATVSSDRGSAWRLKKAIEPILDEYDVICIDTPAGQQELVFNSLQASTSLLITMEVDISNLNGLYRLTDIARQIQTSNKDLEIAGVVLTRYDGRPKLIRYLRDQIRDRAQEMGVPYLMEIRQATVVKEAQALQKSLYDYAAQSKPAADYLQLYEMIMK